MIEIAKRKFNPVLIILLCSLIVLVVMQPWNLYFLNDDFEHIPMAGDNLFVRKNFLRPVAILFLHLNKYLFDKWSPGYFYTSWLLHLACSVSVYYLSYKVIEKYASDIPAYVALATALLFLFYPFHAEPLFWVIARGSVIATLFAILSLYFYIRKDENYRCLIISLLLFIAALFTYESIWNALLFYCLISFVNIRKQLASAGKESLHAGIFVIAFVLYLTVRFYSLKTLTGGYEVIDANIIHFPLLVANLAKLVARNFTPPFSNAFFFLIFFSLSVVVYGLATAAMFKKNKASGWLMILLWFGVISGVTTAAPLGIDTHGNESERYIYYSSFFFCFFLAIATTIPRRQEWRYFITGFVIVSGIAGLIIYQANYKYASTVTKATLQFVRKYPNYKKALFIDVPGEYKGALIFRVCLPDAVRWIAPECKYDSIAIISTIENASGILPYKTGEKTWAELSREKRFEVQPDKKVLKDTSGRNIILNENDAIFWFTEKGLYKVVK